MSDRKQAAILFTYERKGSGYVAEISDVCHCVKAGNGWVRDTSIPIVDPELEMKLMTLYALTPEQFKKIQIAVDEMERKRDKRQNWPDWTGFISDK